MEDYSDRVFREIMSVCPSLRSWNKFVVPLMKVLPKTLRDVAAVEAKRRGYKANRERGEYE